MRICYEEPEQNLTFMVRRGVFYPCIHTWGHFWPLVSSCIHGSNFEEARILAISFIENGSCSEQEMNERISVLAFLFDEDIERRTPEEIMGLLEQAWKQDEVWHVKSNTQMYSSSSKHIETVEDFQREAFFLIKLRAFSWLEELRSAFCLAIPWKKWRKSIKSSVSFIFEDDFKRLSQEGQIDAVTKLIIRKEQLINVDKLKTRFLKQLEYVHSPNDRAKIGEKYRSIAKSAGYYALGSIIRGIALAKPAKFIDKSTVKRGEEKREIGCMGPIIMVEREADSGDMNISDGMRGKHIIVPMKFLKVRYLTKDKIYANRNSLVGWPNAEGPPANIPECFPFSYGMELALFALQKLISNDGYRNKVRLRNGREALLVQLKRANELYEAIGLRKRTSRNYEDEDKVKKGLFDLLRYKHPFLLKNMRADSQGRDNSQIRIVYEPIIRAVKNAAIGGLDGFQLMSLPVEDSSINIEGEIKNITILFNPLLFSDKTRKYFKCIESDLVRKVDESRRKLGSEDGKRYWSKEPLFLTFCYYLCNQGGKYVENSSGERYYKFEREFEGLMKRLGLFEIYRTNKDRALMILERTLEIYKDIGYIFEYDCQKSAYRSEIKLIIRMNPEKFAHLDHPPERFLRRPIRVLVGS